MAAACQIVQSRKAEILRTDTCGSHVAAWVRAVFTIPIFKHSWWAKWQYIITATSMLEWKKCSIHAEWKKPLWLNKLIRKLCTCGILLYLLTLLPLYYFSVSLPTFLFHPTNGLKTWNKLILLWLHMWQRITGKAIWCLHVTHLVH